MQRFTNMTRMLQRSVMCVSKALTPHEEHGGSTYGDRRRNGIQHRNSERSQKAAESATRTERSKCQGEAASSERQSREARGRRQRPNRMASTRRQAANGRQRLTEPGDWQRTAGDEQHVTQRETDGRRRACATTPRSFESSIASKQGRHGRKRRNGALLQGQLFKKRRVAHGKEYVVPDGRQHRFHGEAPPREKQAP